MAEQALLQNELSEHQKILAASLSDIKHTASDTKKIADLNTDFSDTMLTGLNRLLLDTN